MLSLCTTSRVFGTFALCATLAACSGADWKNSQVAQGYQPPKQLSVVVTVNADHEDLPEAVEVLIETLCDELESEDIATTVVQGQAPPPGAQLAVVDWDPGSRGARWFFGFGPGKGHMTLSVSVTRPDGTPAITGEVEGWVKGGFFGGSANTSAEEAGVAIAEAIIEGEIDE